MDGNRYQNGHIFKLSTPVATQIDSVYINIRVIVTLQRAIPPFLDVNICALRGAGPGVGSESWLPYGDWMVHPSCVHSQQADFHCEKYAGAGI